MRIALFSFGSQGDIQPFVALGVRLIQAGHDVLLAAPPDFANLAADYGVPFTKLGYTLSFRAPDNQDATAAIEKGQTLKLIREAMKQRRAMAAQINRDVWQAAQGVDAIIYRASVFGAYNVAEKLGLPCAEVAPFPWVKTKEFPGPLFGAGRRFHPLVNWTLGLLTEQLFWQVLQRPAANRQRREELGLPALPFFGPLKRQELAGTPLYYAYSPTVLPRPADWPARIQVTGYLFSDPPAGWQPPAELLAFLERGSAPVYVGFGSMPMQDPEATLRLVLAALEQSGQRGVLQSGWAGIGAGRQLPAHVFSVDHIPHSWLFPRMAAVVHHGGAGTTGAALRSGVPSVVVPFTADQPFWAERVHRLGVSPAPLPYKQLTASQLAKALHTAVHDPVLRQRAAAVGRQLETEDGAGRVIELFSEYVERWQHAQPAHG